MYTKILSERYIFEAAKIIRNGGVVVFPTETVYGVGANIYNEYAVRKVFKSKNRPADNPLIVHVASVDEVEKLCSNIPHIFNKLVDKFWPGPLTIILKKKDYISNLVSGGLDTVAVRMPSSFLARKLIKYSNVPICAPSANISGRPSATKFEHTKDLVGRVNAIVKGEDCNVGLESTVLDLTKEVPVILRKGYVTKEELEKTIGKVNEYKKGDEIISPGLKYKHYAPKTDVIIIDAEEEKLIEFYKKNKNFVFVVPPEYKNMINMERVVKFYNYYDNDYGAKNLFDLLHVLDRKKYEKICFVKIDNVGVGSAVMDRLLRAASGEIIKL